MAKFSNNRPSEGPDDEPEHQSARELNKLKFAWKDLGMPSGAEAQPVIVDKRIWEIAKKVEVPAQQTDRDTEFVYWATVVKLYQDMGGRFEFKPPAPPTNN